jgi:hypothetical protein
LDTIRSDGSHVVLKVIEVAKHPNEAVIGKMLSTEPLASHPANQCVPILEVLEVMPWLLDIEDPSFETIGEAVEFFRQGFEALKLMHDNLIAHRYYLRLLPIILTEY